MLKKIQSQLYFMGVLAGIFLASILGIIFFSDPLKSGAITLVLFYLAIFFFSINFFGLVLYGMRSRIKNIMHQQKMNVALRQALWIAIFIVGSLFLSSKGLMHWWIELTFIITLGLIEGFFLV